MTGVNIEDNWLEFSKRNLQGFWWSSYYKLKGDLLRLLACYRVHEGVMTGGGVVILPIEQGRL